MGCNMPKTKKMPLAVTNPREEIVAQGNDLIRHARFKLTAVEQNIIYFAMSKIKPTSKDFERLTFSVEEFCVVCGIKIEGGTEYRRIKRAVKAVSDKSAWATYADGTEELIRWFDTVKIQPNTGEISILFSQSMKPYLIGLIERAKAGGEGYTQTMLLTHLALRSRYSKRIYEVLKSYLYANGSYEKIYKQTYLEYDLIEFKLLVNAETYDRYPDLRRKVLAVAESEINTVTDIHMSFTPITHGRKITGVAFTFQHKKDIDRLAAHQAAIDALHT